MNKKITRKEFIKKVTTLGVGSLAATGIGSTVVTKASKLKRNIIKDKINIGFIKYCKY